MIEPTLDKPAAPKVTDLRLLPAVEWLTQPEHVRWVGWKYEWVKKADRDGKWTKVPYQLGGRHKARNNHPADWSRYEEVWGQYLAGVFDGIGMMLLGLEGFAAIDLDKVRDPAGGVLLPWAEGLAECGSYCEITPSMAGLRVLGRYAGSKVHRNGPHPGGGHFELFANCERYITFTGLSNGTADCFEDITPHFDGLLARLGTRDNGHDNNGAVVAPPPENQPEILLEELPDWVRELIVEGRSEGRKVKQRGPQCWNVLRHLHRKGYGFEQAVGLIQRYPDGVFGKYEGRLAEEATRIWTKLEAPVLSELPVIAVDPGQHEENTKAGLEAISSAPFYNRGRSIVHVVLMHGKSWDGKDVSYPSIEEVSKALLTGKMSDAAWWQRRDEKGDPYRVAAPKAIVEMAMDLPGAWPFPTLRGVIGAATVRPDGSLLIKAGYDPATGYVLVNPPKMPPIPERPSRDEALGALATLDGLLEEFPFANAASRSVALSGMMTAVARCALDVVPMHGLTAPDAGTGKSYYVDMVSMLACGDRAAVVCQSTRNEEETEKRLVAAALSGRAIIPIDNCDQPLTGNFLNQVTERARMEIRPLGTSKDVLIDNTFTVFSNGNNLQILADQTRRVVLCSLDANLENPTERTFKSSPLNLIKADRGKYIAAVLTVIRGFCCATGVVRLDYLSYDSWSHLVRSPLVWLGRADPVSSVIEIRNQDPTLRRRAAVFAAWPAGGWSYTTGELIRLAEDGHKVDDRDRLWHALVDVAGEPGGGINPRKLGWWLAKQAKTVSGDLKLQRYGDAWKVEPLEPIARG